MSDQPPATPPTEPPTGPPTASGVEASPDAASAPTTRSGPGARTWIITAVVVALIAGGTVFLVTRSDSKSSASSSDATAQGRGQGRGPGTRGTISSIKGSTLSVDQTDGTVTKVVTDSSTTVSMSIDGKLSDIKVGDQITAIGAVTGTSISATRIADQGNAAELQAQRQQQQQQRQQNGQGQNGAQDPQGQNQQQGGRQGFTPPTDATGNTIARPQGGFPGGENGQQAPNGQAPGGAGGGFTMGEVTAVGANSLTMKTNDGTVYTVTLAADGTVTRTVTGKVSDLKVGDTVTIIGTTASDGTVTATRITSGTGGFGGAGGPGGQGGPQGLNGQGSGLGQGSSTTAPN